MKNIVIVGFPGAGKTTIGRKIAEQLHLEFVDLDDAIESKYHATIPHIFQQYGEFVFRKCEYQTLREQLMKSNVLISTGGGTPCHGDAMQLIIENSLSVYLKLSEECLIQRLSESKKARPLIKNLDFNGLQSYVKQTMILRSPYYEQAHITIEADSLNTEDIERIIAQLSSEEQ